MKKTLFLFILQLPFILLAQEICSNGIDDDGDGLIDCYDNDCADSSYCDGFFLSKPETPLSCRYFPERDTTLEIEQVWSTPFIDGAGSMQCAVGDIDSDGDFEMVIATNGTIEILDGQTGLVDTFWSLPANYAPSHPAIADVDNDGLADIFTVAIELGFPTSKFHLMRYDINGNIIWETETSVTPNNPFGTAAPFVANFNYDDTAEISVFGEIFNSITGEQKIFINDTTLITALASYLPIAMDVLPDDSCMACGGLEFITGNHVYSIDLENDTAILEAKIDMPRGMPSIADIDNDQLLDIIVVAPNVLHFNAPTSADTTLVYAWNPRTETLIRNKSIPNNGNGGRANVGNFDDDIEVEIGFAGAFNYVALDNDFSILWETPIDDVSSSVTGSSLFDFNCDGKKEIVYRDERFLHILNAENGNIIEAQPCLSGTSIEYPIIADITNDGQANILCSCQDAPDVNPSKYKLFKSKNDDWVGTRSVWNQFSYFGVNINDNLTVPKVQQNQAHNSLSELNTYLNQPTLVDEFGNPICFEELYDLSITIDSAVSECDSVVTFVSVCNLTLMDIYPNDIPITFYMDTILTFSDTITDTLFTETCTNYVFKFPLSSARLWGTINKSAEKHQLIAECDSANNLDSFFIEDFEILADIKSTILLLEQGEQVQIETDIIGDTFFWTPSITPNAPMPIVSGDSSFTLYLIVQNLDGCEDMDTIRINVINNTIAFPSIFSPNGDGINDHFYPLNPDAIKSINEFVIYNRWGEIIYNGGTSWDGTHNNKLQEIGVYRYIFSGILQNDENATEQGSVVLMR